VQETVCATPPGHEGAHSGRAACRCGAGASNYWWLSRPRLRLHRRLRIEAETLLDMELRVAAAGGIRPGTGGGSPARGGLGFYLGSALRFGLVYFTFLRRATSRKRASLPLLERWEPENIIRSLCFGLF
jgi:hypothetical protein